MKEKIIKFIIIALTAFFSATMAYADNKYPYVERVEIGCEPIHFEYNDSLKVAIPQKMVVKANKEDDNSQELLDGFDVILIFLIVVLYIIVCCVSLFLVLGLGGIALLWLTHWYVSYREITNLC